MCTPSVTVSLPRPCTESASSISVVLESAIVNACTGASGSSPAMPGAASGAKPVPLGNQSNRKRFQWNW